MILAGQVGAGWFDCFVPSGALSAILIPTFQGSNVEILLRFSIFMLY